MMHISDQFTRDLSNLLGLLESIPPALIKELKREHGLIGQMVRTEVVKRTPVDMGTLRKSWHSTVETKGENVETHVGTPIRGYPVFLEFGTDYIARGAVKRLGTSLDIDDDRAIHNWPAKQGEATTKTSSSRRDGVLFNRDGVEVAGPQEQMPMVRPALNDVREDAIEMIADAVRRSITGAA